MWICDTKAAGSDDCPRGIHLVGCLSGITVGCILRGHAFIRVRFDTCAGWAKRLARNARFVRSAKMSTMMGTE